MAIPDYQSIMLPLLKLLSDKQKHTTREAIVHISNVFSLTEDEKRELLPSGKQPIIDNRVGWARTYLVKAGIADNPVRGVIKINETGLKVLNENPKEINVKFLEKFPEFIEFRTLRKDQGEVEEEIEKTEDRTPDELMEKGYNAIKANLGQELLGKLKSNSSGFFEKVVLALLNNMGYGKGEVTGRSGDGGVDGFINQDKLGLDKIYFQAKRFNENTLVSSSMLRDFLGALELKGANKGVFITTSKFPKGSEETLSNTVKNVTLINGTKLVELMMEYNVGVQKENIYEIKKVDIDFFSEE